MRVVFINMIAPSNPVQRSVAGIMDAAARDLGIELVQHNAAYWPGEKLELVRQVVNGPRKRYDFSLQALLEHWRSRSRR